MSSVPLFAFKFFSACETAAVEEGLFLRRCGAAEHGIPMRKAAEATNDVCMQFRPFQIFNVADRFIKGDTALLIGQIFRVLKRKVKEAAHFGRNLAVETTHDSTGGNGPRERVGGESPRVTAKHVARKLIEKDEQRERALRALLPIGQFSGSGRLKGFEKSLPDLLVEACILVEPPVRPRRAPKRNDFVRSRGHCHPVQLAAGPAASSRKARRRILPTLVLGNSSRNSICFGTL